MNDWNLWLSSNETRTALRILEDTTNELKDLITSGAHMIEKKADSIALDYTYSIGQLDGMKTLINMLHNMKDETNNQEEL